jgi:hypothetical protein
MYNVAILLIVIVAAEAESFPDFAEQASMEKHFIHWGNTGKVTGADSCHLIRSNHNPRRGCATGGVGVFIQEAVQATQQTLKL